MAQSSHAVLHFSLVPCPTLTATFPFSSSENRSSQRTKTWPLWCELVIPAFERQRQGDALKFEATVSYIVTSSFNNKTLHKGPLFASFFMVKSPWYHLGIHRGLSLPSIQPSPVLSLPQNFSRGLSAALGFQPLPHNPPPTQVPKSPFKK